jgi:hypothetical protein
LREGKMRLLTKNGRDMAEAAVEAVGLPELRP